jgi:hypothetical protein
VQRVTEDMGIVLSAIFAVTAREAALIAQLSP